MLSATLIFPHQLFKHHPALQEGRRIYLVEEFLFFRQYQFNRQKLILHRASMQYYKDLLQRGGYNVEYIATSNFLSDIRELIRQLAIDGIKEIYIADVADNWLLKRIAQACGVSAIQLHVLDSPNFLNTIADASDFFIGKGHYHQTDFYIAQRQQRNILLQSSGEPIGGKWSFDSENRKRFPARSIPPLIIPTPDNIYLKEARAYVEEHFSGNYGKNDQPHLFAVTHADAEKWFDDFLEQRFAGFGLYEDAIVGGENVLYHSVLTPVLNIGLLDPAEILQRAITYAEDHKIPLNSVEGFVRQIMGWREFMHITYELIGTKQRTTNYWGFTRKLPSSFWTAQTGILPIDITIRKILRTGYCHHIERLMVLGNFMLLCEFDPNDVYRWFMEMFIDSYDWVMVPNVYGMSQFADGGLMTTKPYISGSNYLVKMSDYPKGPWQQIWDDLFWRFMHTYRDFFSTNPRLSMLVDNFDRMDKITRSRHIENANKFLEKADLLNS